MGHLLNFIKGVIVGIGNIIPGVSGGTLAIICGVYERIIDILSNIIKGIKENFFFLVFFGLGAITSIVVGSILIPLALNQAPLATILFFTGLIIGGFKLLYNKVKNHKITIYNIITLIITMGIILTFTFLNPNTEQVNFENLDFIMVVILFLIGILAAAAMIIPGISGSLLLMLLGFYEPILNTIKNIISFNNFWHNAFVLIPFGIGCLLGIVVISIILKYLLKHYEINTYYGIIGFVVSSIVGIFYNQLDVIKEVFAANSFGINLLQVLIGIILFTLGAILTYRLSKLEN